jgi:hypothetical protein
VFAGSAVSGTIYRVTQTADLLLGVLDDVEPLMRAAFAAVGGTPEPGSHLDQVFLLDGRVVVAEYLRHGEPALALDHLLYMIEESDLPIGLDTRRKLNEAAHLSSIHR